MVASIQQLFRRCRVHQPRLVRPWLVAVAAHVFDDESVVAWISAGITVQIL